MSKKFLFGFVLGLAFVVGAVLWLLSVVAKESFGWFSLGWAVVLVAGVFGIAFVVRGVVTKTAIPLKKLSIYFGAGFFVVAIFALVGELALDNKIIMPVIAIVLAVALLLGFVAVGGKNWDAGDNQKVGYKNYYERKKEQDEKEKEQK